jgi:hypothetical protein
MNPWLLNILSNFSWGAHSIALGLTGVACLRLSKRGADWTFAVAAWLAFAGTLLMCLPWMLSWVLSYLRISPRWWRYTVYISILASILLFGHFLLFAIAAFRTANRLPTRVRTEQVSREQELPSE